MDDTLKFLLEKKKTLILKKMKDKTLISTSKK